MRMVTVLTGGKQLLSVIGNCLKTFIKMGGITFGVLTTMYECIFTYFFLPVVGSYVAVKCSK